MTKAVRQDTFSSLFAPEASKPELSLVKTESVWKVLLVDDEPDIHALFRLAIQDIIVEQRSLQLFSAMSAAEAEVLISKHADMALVLLDVVMETSHAGLSLTQHIRQQLNNTLIQIVLITGQPGYAPQKEVIANYDINGYRLKSELTIERIYAVVYVAIRSHFTLLSLVEKKKLLEESESKSHYEHKLRSFIVESSEDAIVGLTLDGLVTSWNLAAEKIFSYSAKEMLNHTIERIMPDDCYQNYQTQMQAIRDAKIIDLFETEALTKGGTRISVFMTLSAILNNEKHNVGISLIIRDITERKQTEKRLRLAANVFTHAREAIMITDAKGTILDVNDTFSRNTGYSREEVLGKKPSLLNSGRQSKLFYNEMWKQLIEKGHWYGEMWNRRKDGEVYIEKKTISAVHNSHGEIQNFVALCSDITVYKNHEKQLEHIAHYDALTDLPNRVLLADRLHQGMKQILRRNLMLGVAFLDLDGFKAINDSFGHDAGDVLLISLASHMTKALRAGDTLSRIGGDEFVVVLGDLLCVEDCLPMLERLLEAASQPIVVGERVLQVSASLGVTFYPQQQDTDADQLIRQADQAMYQAKLLGKNRFHIFDAEQDSSIRVYHESIERIQHALDAEEFVLYYQPKVNMSIGSLVGVEALIRWQHPEKGLLPPADFLSVIEEHQLDVEIGEWVIDTALTQIANWSVMGLSVPISVNVSAHQLQHDGFVKTLRNLLATHSNVDPSYLEIEILETSALEDVRGVSEIMSACRAMGVKFALDDFGTGYSSLTYLKRLPVNLLKIDQSFVRDMLKDADDLAIIEGVVGLARAFRRDIIAEGVETIEHGTMLLQFGCELAQGYGIGRPMPATQLVEWTEKWQSDPAWQDVRKVSHNDLPLVFAHVEHNAWINSVERYLTGESHYLPSQDYLNCRLGTWLAMEGYRQYGASATFLMVDKLHNKIHLIAEELMELYMQAGKYAAQERLPELYSLRNKLFDQLKILTQEIQH